MKMIIDCNQEEMCSGLNRLRSAGELKIEVKYLKKNDSVVFLFVSLISGNPRE